MFDEWVHRAKAVAEGAIHAHLYKSVTGRVSKNTYGILCNRTYHANDPVHVNQRDVSCTLGTGTVVLPKAFHCIIEKVRITNFRSWRYCYIYTVLGCGCVGEDGTQRVIGQRDPVT